MLQALTDFVPASSNSQLILVVEDEVVSRKAMANLLSFAGYRVMALPTAEQALEFASNQPNQIIALVDFNLEGMDGLEFINRLRLLGLCAKGILITATGDESVRELARENAIPFLQKPVNLRQVLAIVADPLGAY